MAQAAARRSLHLVLVVVLVAGVAPLAGGLPSPHPTAFSASATRRENATWTSESGVLKVNGERVHLKVNTFKGGAVLSKM